MSADRETRKSAGAIYRMLAKTYPEVDCELDFQNPLQLVIATLLSAQCTDVNVNNVTKSIYKKYYTPKHFADLGINKIRNLIKSIGLFNNKAKNLYYLSKILLEKHQSRVPNNLEDLILLPGVGRKTANVVLNEVFNKIGVPVFCLKRSIKS